MTVFLVSTVSLMVKKQNMGFPGGSDGKEYACKPGDLCLQGIFPGEWNGKPLQYPCLVNSMYRATWQATVHGIAELDMTEQLIHRT